MRLKEILKKILPSILLSWYHFLLALLGAVFYQFPSRQMRGSPSGAVKKMIVIGITGTNGKSTVVELASKILEEGGYKVASLSSIKFKIKEKEWPNDLKMTMPGRFQVQRFLRQALHAGCQYVILEVTSEGIKQYRHKFIDFSVAVFTNLTPEHIEAHGSFEKYKITKGKLFQATRKVHVINADDENTEYFSQFQAKRKWAYGINTTYLQKTQASQDLQGRQIPDITHMRAQNIQANSSGVRFSVQDTQFSLKLLGEFNIYNSLAAICVGLSQGLSLENCKLALEKVEGIPGRMEVVISDPFQVFVDYAFTPEALKKVYQTIQNLKPKTYNLKPKIICILGAAGGGRDKWKRPVLGKLAGKYCDQTIVTNEDPYDEDPNKILSEIKAGIFDSQFPMTNFFEILDRRKAIKKALSLARPKDMVIITGKGSEPWICVARGRKLSWDDRQVVREEFKKLHV